ncbi:putative ABC transporter permease YvrN [alpha proteobacterium Q-1]|nr:putative ABC transporter permease YvrN [alpha proteobacterium Q-1]
MTVALASLSLIWANLSRSRLRFALTAFAIFIAFFLFGILQSFERGLNAGADLAAADRLIISNRINFTQPLPIAYVNRIAAIEGVRQVSHQSWMGSYYQEPRNFIFGFAIDPQSYLQIYADDIALPPEQAAAFIQNRRGALVGEDVAKQYGWQIGDLIPISSNIWQRADGSNVWDLVIEGIYRAGRANIAANTLYLHYDYLNEARTTARDFTGTISFTTLDPAQNDAIAQAIDSRFQNSAYATETRTEEAFNRSFVEQLGNIGLIVLSVSGAAMFTILIITGNTMALSIRERTGEIGVMKVLGFDARMVFALILAESLALALIGGLLGVAAAQMMARFISTVPGFPFPLGFTSGIWLSSFGLMLALGLITGLLPAFAAYRLKPTAAFARA